MGQEKLDLPKEEDKDGIKIDCISVESHNRIFRRVNFWHVGFHITWAVLLAFSIYLSYHFNLERGLLQEKYASVKVRNQMLEMLRMRPLTIRQAMDITDEVIDQNRVPVEVVFAVMQQESELRPKAVSQKGAKGLMQVMPVTWKIYSHSYKEVTDPVQNVRVGILYLSDLFDQFHDWKEVFRAYYAGPQNYNNRNYDWYANAVLKRVADFRGGMKNLRS